MKAILVLAIIAGFGMAGFSAYAQPSTPPPGWATESTQGGSDNECNDNPGCTEVSQPPGQVDKDLDNNAPETCEGPPGQCAKQEE